MSDGLPGPRELTPTRNPTYVRTGDPAYYLRVELTR
jgi:hypothetical protein